MNYSNEEKICQWIPICAVEFSIVQLINSRVAIIYREPAYNFMPCGGAVLVLPFIWVLLTLNRYKCYTV